MPSLALCPPPESLQELFTAARPPRQSDALLHHLEDCPSCRAFLATNVDRDAVHPAFRASLERTQPIRLVNPVADWTVGPGTVRASDDADLPRRIGRYEVVGVLGRGGMGVVVKAVDPTLNRFVAIKLLSREVAVNLTARERFLREGEAASRIGSDNVVAVHEFGESDGTPYLVMQYVRSEDLRTRLRQGPPIRPEEALRIARHVAAGLAAAHAQGVIHRDIKPENILLQSAEDSTAPLPGSWVGVKIADFGVARMVGTPGLTGPGVVVGTPEYIAPEQIENTSVDHRCDLYSLGVVLYRMLAGRLPFTARSVVEFLDYHRRLQPPPIASLASDSIPAWLNDLVLQLLRKDPAERIQTAEEVVRRLDEALAQVADPAQ